MRRELLCGAYNAIIGLDAIAGQHERGHGRDRHHVHGFQHLPKVGCGASAAMRAIAYDHRRLAGPLLVKVIERVFKRRRLTPVVLRRHEDESRSAGDLGTPGVRVRVRITLCRRDPRLVIRRQRPVLEIDDFKRV